MSMYGEELSKRKQEEIDKEMELELEETAEDILAEYEDDNIT